MKYKKITAMVISALMCFSLVACSGNTEPSLIDKKRSETAMTVGDRAVTAMEFQICFYSQYNNFLASTSGGISYGLDTTKTLSSQTCGISGYTDMTWQQYFCNATESYCREVFAAVAEANAEGFEMPQADRDDLAAQNESFRSAMKSDAEQNNQSEQTSVETLYGKDATYEDIDAVNELLALSASYTKSKSSKDFSDEEIAAYYEAEKSSIDTLNLRVAPIYYITDSSQNNPNGYDTKEAAYAKATEFASRVTSEETYIALLEEYINEKIRNYYGAIDYSLSKNVKNTQFAADPDGQAWAFDESRQEGDVHVIDIKTAYLVVYYISRDTKDYNYANIRTILIKETTDESKQKAEELYNSWLAGGATEESFAALAKEKSEDTGSNTNGGLYSDKEKNEFYSSLDNWIFAEGRKQGDSGIVLGSYGYYLLYFSKAGDNIRRSLTVSAMQLKLYNEFVESLNEKYAYTTNSEIMLSVVV